MIATLTKKKKKKKKKQPAPVAVTQLINGTSIICVCDLV